MVKSNSKVSSNDVYGRVIYTSQTGEKTNAYTYQKMKNKITYGSQKKDFLNKGKRKMV